MVSYYCVSECSRLWWKGFQAWGWLLMGFIWQEHKDGTENDH